MKRFLTLSCLLILLTSCSLPASTPAPEPAPATEAVSIADTATLPPPTVTFTALPPTETFTPIPPTATATETPIPFVESLDATVTAERLSCRYGPGPEYLYLFGFRSGAKIQVIGRADNDWLLVENEPQRCWVKPEFLSIDGDLHTLKSMYPDGYKLPESPYYAPTSVISSTREGDNVTVVWAEVKVDIGDYEDESMFPYLVEVWRCENGQLIFEQLVSTYPVIKFVDQEGCALPSHGRIYIQEKHGFAGPTDIPWPAR